MCDCFQICSPIPTPSLTPRHGLGHCYLHFYIPFLLALDVKRAQKGNEIPICRKILIGTKAVYVVASSSGVSLVAAPTFSLYNFN